MSSSNVSKNFLCRPVNSVLPFFVAVALAIPIRPRENSKSLYVSFKLVGAVFTPLINKLTNEFHKEWNS